MTEAAEAIGGRLGRSALTSLAVTVGVLTLVGTIGVAGNGGRVLEARFDEYAARTITVEGWDHQSPRDAKGLDRVARLPGVVGVGGFSPVSGGELRLSRNGLDAGEPVEVVAVEGPSALAALSATVVFGRWWDHGTELRCDRVVVLGDVLAAHLGYDSSSLGRTVWLDGSPRTLLGVIESPSTMPAVSSQVLVPAHRHCGSTGSTGPPIVVARTAPGIARAVRRAAPYALSTTNPQGLSARTEMEPESLRTLVLGDSQRMLVSLALIALLVSIVVISVSLMSSVNERRGEIGLRRAVGASRSDIILHMLMEALFVGLLGGIHGVIAGVIVTSHHALMVEVAPDLRWSWLALALCSGVVAGAFGGVVPAVRASRIDPAAALTS